jgi:hypothetical protein
MESSQLYTKLLQTGERLFQALACERDASIFNCQDLGHAKRQHRLLMVRRQVKCAAEDYALALKTYRVAMLSEFLPFEIAPQRGAVRAEKRRDTLPAATSPFRTGRSHATRSTRKDTAAEGFPLSTRRVKLQ